MVNPFQQTPAEKEEYVLEMLEHGYGWKQIMKECHVSPNTISNVKKKFFGSSDADASKSTSQVSKETQALKLFGEGKTLLQVATELDIDADNVFVIYQKFQRLKNNEVFISMYEHVKGNIKPFLNLFDLMNGLRMTPEGVAQLAGYGIRLPYLGNIYSKLCNDVQILESQKRNFVFQLNWAQNQLGQIKASLDFYYKESEEKRSELLSINNEINARSNFIHAFDNQEGYQRIKKQTAEQTESIIKNNPLLIAITVSSSIEAIRRYPRNQQLFYDLSIRQGYSGLSQETWIQSHTTQLLQLSEQVQIEIAEQITKMVVSKIQENDSNSAGILVVSHGQTPPPMTYERQSLSRQQNIKN